MKKITYGVMNTVDGIKIHYIQDPGQNKKPHNLKAQIKDFLLIMVYRQIVESKNGCREWGQVLILDLTHPNQFSTRHSSA